MTEVLTTFSFQSLKIKMKMVMREMIKVTMVVMDPLEVEREQLTLPYLRR